MNIEAIRNYVLSKPFTEEGFPFGESTLVFRVNGKIFLLMGMDQSPLQFNVKCDPEKAIALREQYSCIIPGYHMNKKHWNTVIIDSVLPASLLWEMINDSYNLVANSKSTSRSSKKK